MDTDTRMEHPLECGRGAPPPSDICHPNGSLPRNGLVHTHGFLVPNACGRLAKGSYLHVRQAMGCQASQWPESRRRRPPIQHQAFTSSSRLSSRSPSKRRRCARTFASPCRHSSQHLVSVMHAARARTCGARQGRCKQHDRGVSDASRTCRGDMRGATRTLQAAWPREKRA